jgi:dienelactone hydrolase
MRRPCVSLLLVSATLLACSGKAEPVQSWFNYPSSITVLSNRWINLNAELHYDDAVTNAPIAVVMHGYSLSSTVAGVRENAQRLRDAGFFAIAVTMRGREGSEGTRDSGGLEIHDIYDAVEAVKTRYARLVNPTNVHITGYSGGGGNTLSALTKFPDYFCLGAAFFGMSDYGFDPVHGWYFHGANQGGIRTNQLDADVGNPFSREPRVRDRYLARASNLAARNNPYSEIHLFVNWDERICPPLNFRSYQSNALAAATYPGEFGNIQLHIGTNGVYHDFNGNGRDEPEEQQWWPHGHVDAAKQAAAESWYLARLKRGLLPPPQLKDQANLFVAGWVKTRRFELWLGDGQNAAADLSYSLSPTNKQFTLRLASSDKGITGRLIVDTRDMLGQTVAVNTNGVFVKQIIGKREFTWEKFCEGQTLALIVR